METSRASSGAGQSAWTVIPACGQESGMHKSMKSVSACSRAGVALTTWQDEETTSAVAELQGVIRQIRPPSEFGIDHRTTRHGVWVVRSRATGVGPPVRGRRAVTELPDCHQLACRWQCSYDEIRGRAAGQLEQIPAVVIRTSPLGRAGLPSGLRLESVTTQK